MARSHIYIAGPIGVDGHTAKYAAFAEAANRLCAMGLFPFVPFMPLWHLQCPRSYEEWMAYDAAWLSRCDAVLRLTGTSPGADREVEQARGLGLPVFFLADRAWQEEISAWASR